MAHIVPPLFAPSALAQLCMLAVVATAATASSAQVSLATRIQAAQATANDPRSTSPCGRLSQNATGSNDGFYWEIGDENGVVMDPASGLRAAGSVQPQAGGAVLNYTRTTRMPFASSTKMIYGAFVAERLGSFMSGALQIPAQYVPFLNFTSGHTNMVDTSCPATETPTVKACMDKVNGGVANGALSPADKGYFYYNGGHMQVFEGNGDPAVGNVMNGTYDGPNQLAADINAAFNARGVTTDIAFFDPMPPGGAMGSAADYAPFLQGIVRSFNPLKMKFLLNPTAHDPYAVCTSTVDPKCRDASGKPLSHYTPVPPTESWHYGVGHWIEDDPRVGDGAYSSPGKFGFYPWVDASKSYYGILARHDTGANAPQGYKSAVCGRSIRKAFMTGVVQSSSASDLVAIPD